MAKQTIRTADELLDQTLNGTSGSSLHGRLWSCLLVDPSSAHTGGSGAVERLRATVAQKQEEVELLRGQMFDHQTDYVVALLMRLHLDCHWRRAGSPLPLSWWSWWAGMRPSRSRLRSMMPWSF